MKRRREGTLQRVELTPADGVAWVEALAKITNGGTHTLEGILDAAARLAHEQMQFGGTLRADTARRLSGAVTGARSMIERSPDRRSNVIALEDLADPARFPWDARDMIWVGLRIGLDVAALRTEIRDDARRDQRRRITRAAYFKAKREHGTQERIAGALGVSVQALRKWRIANIEE